MYAYDYIYIKKHSFIYLCFDLPPSALHHDGHRIVCPGPIYPVQVNLRSEEADLSLFFLHASVICSTYIPHSEVAIHSVKLKSRAAWSGVNGMLRTPRSPGTGIIYNSPSNPFPFVSTWLLFRNIQNGNMSIFLNLDA